MASEPRVYFGRTDNSALWRTSEGFLDGPTSDGADPPAYTGGTAYSIRARGVKVAPSGPNAETMFAALMLVVTHTMAVDLVVTPILDGVAQDGTGGTSDERVTIELEAAEERVTQKFFLGLTLPYLVDAVEQGRNAQRATWFEAMVESSGDLAEGDLLLEANLLEFEPSEDTVAETT